MRTITIKRTKSLIGSISKMKIYIEDQYADEIKINGTPCKKVGVIKNGGEISFLIENTATKIFVISDKISKNYCNEYYQIPEGNEDITLTGKNKFNIINGNAFIFDNNFDEGALLNRKKNNKKGILILCIAGVIGFLLGYSFTSNLNYNYQNSDGVFSDNGLTITLNSEFIHTPIQGYTNCYGSEDVAVFILKEPFALFTAEIDTIEEYSSLVLENNNLPSTALKQIDGLTGFEREFTNPDTDETYKYYSYIYESDDAFWLIQFATLVSNIDEYEQSITEWAKSVSFY